MPENRVAENVLGTIGTVCWTCQILPQNWKSWRERSTEGLSAYLMFLWAVAAVFLGIYNLSRDINLPLIVQPQIFGFLSVLSWVQCLYYSQKRSLRFCLFMLTLYCLIGGGFEAGMVSISKHELNKGNERPVQFFAIATSVMFAMGLLPQYWEIWKRKKVIGVSYYFITVDTLGGVFSLLSLVFKPEFDILAAIAYSLVVVMDLPILISALILNPSSRNTHHGSVSNEDMGMEANQPVAPQNQETRHSVKPSFWTRRKSAGENNLLDNTVETPLAIFGRTICDKGDHVDT